MANYRLDQFGLWNRVYPVNFPFNTVSGRGSSAFATTMPYHPYPAAFERQYAWRRAQVNASTRRRTTRARAFDLSISRRYAAYGRARGRRSGYSGRGSLGVNVPYRRGRRANIKFPRRGAYTRNRVLNPISQSRVIRVRQRMLLNLAPDTATATAHALETDNSITNPVLKLCVSTQPFCVLSLLGNVKPFHSVSSVADGSADHFGIRACAGSAAWNEDQIAICKRYASFRVAAMKVTLYLNEMTLSPSGVDVNWVNASRGMYVIRSAFDRLDTQQVMPEIALTSAALAYPTAPNLYQLRRLPYFTERRSSARYHEQRNYDRHHVLFNRRFAPSKTTGGELLVSGVSSINAVPPGGWDNRALQEAAYANAYDVMNAGSTASEKMYRAGKLFIDIRPEQDNGDLTWLEFFNGATTDNIMGSIVVEYEIHLRNDVDAFRPN